MGLGLGSKQVPSLELDVEGHAACMKAEDIIGVRGAGVEQFFLGIGSGFGAISLGRHESVEGNDEMGPFNVAVV
jgi:hypothetical protein